ncbi:hypothetical protein DdX_21481 [Ditylenchus destructor]|uniref:Uncharacterized protein n=1 Tax=Ditylenchus destructor TaxID=166010 RepID=A0AAD4QVN7_9BILA|nr:hypothetical protein DdX_21481 [Ditylenchus destructor]
MTFSPIKAQIRERYGSIKAFEQAFMLKPGMVRDHLRGRSVAAAETAILREFGPPIWKCLARSAGAALAVGGARPGNRASSL